MEDELVQVKPLKSFAWTQRFIRGKLMLAPRRIAEVWAEKGRVEIVETPKKKRLGRPPGSKNKPKTETAAVRAPKAGD